MFLEHAVKKSSADVSSPRHPGVQGRPSGRMSSRPSLMLDCLQLFSVVSPQPSTFHSVVSAVGGLLQTRFTPGLLLPHLSDTPRLPPPPSLFAPRASPGLVEPSRLSQWAGPGPSSFMLPSRPAEVSIRTVGACRLGGPVPLKESVTQGKVSAPPAVNRTRDVLIHDFFVCWCISCVFLWFYTKFLLLFSFLLFWKFHPQVFISKHKGLRAMCFNRFVFL